MGTQQDLTSQNPEQAISLEMQKYSGSQGQITTINRNSKTISSTVNNSNDLKQQHLPTEGAWCSYDEECWKHDDGAKEWQPGARKNGFEEGQSVSPHRHPGMCVNKYRNP